jgi:hypothetical protein
MLPVEFARESAGGKITLVICKDVPLVQTLWTLLDAQDIVTARHQLGIREYADATPKWIDTRIGFWDTASGASHGEEAETIAAWAKPREFAGVVWTNLGCGFKDKTRKDMMPSAEDILAHLRSLEGKQRDDAEEYVRKAPEQVDTAYRRNIVRELGWHFQPGEA